MVARAGDQAPVVLEPVAGREDRGRRLVVVAGRAGREVGQVRDDQPEVARQAVEQVAVDEVDACAETLGVRRCDFERARAGVARPDLDRRRAQRERDRDGAGAGADVGDARRLAADPLECGVDELLGRRARREDPAGIGDEGESVEVEFAYLALVQRSPMDWIARADTKRARYEEQHGELDERALVRRGNTAYAAGLSLSDGR